MNKIRAVLTLGAGHTWVWHSRFRRGLQVAPTVRAVGRPDIRLAPGARIDLATGVVLNSSPAQYHAGMFSRVTLIADKSGATLSIGEDTRINGAIIHAQSSVSIGRRVLVAAQATILDSNGHVTSPPESRLTQRDVPRPVVIEDDVWIGLGAVILPGTHIGRGSIIGANAVAAGWIRPGSIVRASMEIRPLGDAT